MTFNRHFESDALRLDLNSGARSLARTLALMLMFYAKGRASTVSNVVVAVLVAAGGILFLTDVIFLRPDPQGGIAVLFTPLYQALGAGVLLPTCQWLFGKLST